MRGATLALISTGALLSLAVVVRRRGRVSWWTSDGQLALPAIHPADRSLVDAAEQLIRYA